MTVKTAADFGDPNGNPYADPNDPLGAPTKGITDPTVKAAGTPTNTNPFFDPGTNITPGVDVPLAKKTPTPPPPTPGGPPSGGSITDPGYVDQLLAYYANQPGANPSVKNDPNYWRQAAASGRFNGDTAYFIQWLMTPEGPPEGAQVGTNNNGMLTGSADTGQYQQLQSTLQQQMAMQQQEMQQQQAMREQFRQSILGQLGKLQNDTTSTDPTGDNLRPIISAYHVQSQRGLDRTRNALAEANYANGTMNSGGFQSQEQGALENAGAQEANFTGQQVSQAVTARQQQLQHLLDVGAGFISQGDQQAIQTELAQLQAKLQEQQLGYQYSALGQQNNQFGRSLNQNNDQFGRSLGQQNSQFGDQLGYNYTALKAQMDQQALLHAMGY